MNVPAPAHCRGVVLVTGPTSAGVTSMVRELRNRMPARSFVEASEEDGAAAGVAPAAVVFVVSAVAPVTESDCQLVDLATAQTDAVVAVVSKVDDHRNWRGVLAANRERLAECAARFKHVPWVGAAAAPRLGEPLMDGLIELLERQLDDPESVRRNNLRASEFRLRTEMSRLDAEAGADRRARVDALRESREELLRQRLLLGPEATIALRSRIQQARVALTYSARNRCAAARAELLEKVAGTSRRPFGRLGQGRLGQGGLEQGGLEQGTVEQDVRRRCRDIAAEVDEEITLRTREVAADLGLAGLAEPPRSPPTATAAVATFADPPGTSSRLETQLTTVFGTGFGLGVALLVSRLFAGLTPQAPVVGLVAGGVVGLAVTVWVVRSRGLLHDRAVLDRWVHEVASAVRATAEERVATRVLDAEAALFSAYLNSVDARRRTADRRIAAVDAELREHACEIARAEAVREREMPPLLRALQAVHKALAEGNSGESDRSRYFRSVGDPVTPI